MLVIPERKMIFVHIPKTGGIALRGAICKAFPQCVPKFAPGGGHRQLRQEIENYPDYESFAVMRHPYDIYRSWHAWVRGITVFSKIWPEDTVKDIKRCAKMQIDECVETCCRCNILEQGSGFLQTYCLPETVVYRYEDDWQSGVEQRLRQMLDVKRDNVSTVPKEPLSAASKAMIASRCGHDMEQMEYNSECAKVSHA